MSPNLEPQPSSSSADRMSSSMTVTGRASCEAQTKDRHAPQPPSLNHAESSHPTMQQVMDLKLQLAECLAENDTLKHRNSVLTRQNDELMREGSDLAIDLERAYAQITKLKKERDEAVRDLTRAQMLQIRQDSRKAKLLNDDGRSGGNSASGHAKTGSSGSLVASKPKTTKGSRATSWLGRLSVNFKTASSSNGHNHDSFSSTASSSVDIAAVDPKTHTSSAGAGTGTMQSISKSTLNLFNNSTLSFLTSDLGSEGLGVGGGDPNSNSLSSLDRNDVLPGRRSSITMASTANSDSHNGGSFSCTAGTTSSHCRHSRRNTDRDVRGFLSRLSLSSDASLFGSESDSEEDFDDYLVRNDRWEDHKVEGVALGNREELAVDAVHKTSNGASSASVALNTCRLPKRLSLNAREA